MPHASIVTRQRLQELDLDVLMHPPYSPDNAPSNYHHYRNSHQEKIVKISQTNSSPIETRASMTKAL